MKRLFIYILALFVPLLAVAQQYHSLEIDASSLKPVNTDAISGVAIDKIARDPSQRPCARIKMHVNRMTAEDIRGLSVRAIGGNIEVTKQMVAIEGNGLIVELTAKEQTRFYLHHDKYGDSNEVTLNLEGDKEYRLRAQLCIMQSIVVSTNVRDAEVYIDNEFKGKTNHHYALTVDGMTHGVHDLRVVYGGVNNEKKIEINSTNIYFRIEVDTAASEAQFVVFEVLPRDAVVEIDGKNYVPSKYGDVQVTLNNGSYRYTISAKDYHPETGTFVVSGSKVEKSVKLRPAHGWLNLPSEGLLQGAKLFVDDALVGETPIERHKLASGMHDVRIVKELYKTFVDRVEIKDGETLVYTPKLEPDFANVTLKTEEGCDIFINGIRKGTTTWSGDLSTGTYRFEARKANHRNSTITKTISANPSKQSYDIPAPEPIVGTLIITSSPAIASVSVDGKEVGRTPLKLALIVGSHKVTLTKEGFATESKDVKIEEGKTSNMELTLNELQGYASSAATDAYSYEQSYTTTSTAKKSRSTASASSSRVKPRNYKGFESIVELSSMIGIDVIANYHSTINLTYTAGYRFNPYVYLGGGTGIKLNLVEHPTVMFPPAFYEDYRTTCLESCLVSVPLYGYARFNFCNTKCSPFFALAVGGSLSGKKNVYTTSGLISEESYKTSYAFVNPQIGVDFLSKRGGVAYYLAFGFHCFAPPHIAYGYNEYLQNRFFIVYRPEFSLDFHFGVSF